MCYFSFLRVFFDCSKNKNVDPQHSICRSANLTKSDLICEGQPHVSQFTSSNFSIIWKFLKREIQINCTGNELFVSFTTQIPHHTLPFSTLPIITLPITTLPSPLSLTKLSPSPFSPYHSSFHTLS